MDKSYKGAHLHLHFSGVVKVDTLLNTLLTDKWRNQIFWNYNRKSLSFVLEGKRSNFNRGVVSTIKNIIYNTPLSEQYEEFNIVGGMFYDIIKDTRFYPTYVNLIARQMEEENVDHVELRLRLGTLKRPIAKGNRTYVLTDRYYSIEEEIALLYDIVQKIPSFRDGTKPSIKIIPQFSKHKSGEDIYGYFISIVNYLALYPKYRSLIVAFDLTGDEKRGKGLYEFENPIRRILIDMDSIRQKNSLPLDWNIPFFFHAGEISDQKGLDNVRFALKYGGFHPLTRSPDWIPIYDKSASYAPNQMMRIGHGVYSVYDISLVQAIYRHGISLEFCPLSMVHFNNMDNNLLQLLLNSPLMFSLNADDPNKINDQEISANVKYLLSKRVSKEDIALAYRVSILSAQCSFSKRQEMLRKWDRTYMHLFNPILQYIQHPSRSLSEMDNKYIYFQDVDRKWSFYTNLAGFALLTNLIDKVSDMLSFVKQRIEERGLDSLFEIMTGYKLYKRKPSKTYSSDTWKAYEYEHLGLQFLYVRIKSIQRFVETYSLLQRMNTQGTLDPVINRLSSGKNVLRVISIGGGPGFELYAIHTFLQERYPLLDVELISIDPVQSWKPYNEMMGIEYRHGDLHTAFDYSDSLMIFSYVVAQFVSDPSYFRKLIRQNNVLILNEGVKELSVLNTLPHISLLNSKGRDDRQIVIGEDISPGENDNEDLLFPSVPYT